MDRPSAASAIRRAEERAEDDDGRRDRSRSPIPLEEQETQQAADAGLYARGLAPGGSSTAVDKALDQLLMDSVGTLPPSVMSKLRRVVGDFKKTPVEPSKRRVELHPTTQA